jgi:hypothetical protein
MLKTLAYAMIVAAASSTEVSLNGAILGSDYLTEYGALRKDEPLITPAAKLIEDLKGEEECKACTKLVKAADSFI